ncbi:MAG: peptide/nickel transport system substrate-binding protein [Thermomicrobiales bacterium]|nr:peptide/nickel transport system substrate-binding protein [Thermomicrobiales bacterium]
MADVSSLIAALASGRLTRRQFMQRAAALGLSAPLISVLARQPEATFAQEPTVGPAVDVVTFGAYNVDQAPLNIQNGDIDLYIFGLKTAGAQSLQGVPNVRLSEAPASTLSLILNPAPANEGELNPFSIPEVRQAMQYLVDRDFIANDIYQGRAVPMLTNVSPLDYDQLTIFQTVAAANLRFDPQFAGQQITQAMQNAGAALTNNVWTFNGNPIVIKIITRVEDERREIGDTVRAALEQLGFQTQPLYQQFGPATLAVYASDPKTFGWHIYTEGWGRGAPVRYDDGGVNSFYAPWLGNMPGWLEVGFWQYENQQLDDLGKKLFRGEFKSREERDQLFQQMIQIGLGESVRVWLVTALQTFPVRAEMQDLTEDLVSGPKNLFALRGAHIPGRNDIKVGNLWVWTERTTWNPVGGFGDVYSSDIRRNLIDPPVINHPFTGLTVPFRATFTVETAGPDGTLPVPADAVLWDPANDAWAPVAGGATAKSKVTFDFSKYFAAPWHHGQPITMADVIYPIAQGYEIAFDEAKIQIETALGITSRPLLETNKGFRLANDHTLEVYVDYWHFEESYIASYATPSGVATPWELLAAMDDVVFEKRQGAYSDTAAARFTVPWLSMVTESDARLVIRSLRQFKREQAIPAGVFDFGGQSLVTPEQAEARYDAAIQWFTDTNQLVIGNSCFKLTRYDPAAQFAQIDAFRPEGYPFGPADFRLGAPPRLGINPVTPPAIGLGEPISLPVTVTGPGALSLQYTLVDPAAGQVLATGPAEGGEGGNFTVNVDSAATTTLFPGLYQLYLVASSDAIAQVSQQRIDLQVGV